MEATVHCPNCGTEASARQKFCRACGLSLDRFAQLLAELLPDGEDENVAQARRRLRQLEKALKIAGWTIGSALGIFLALVGAHILIKRHDGGGIFPLLFGVGIIAAMFLISYGSSLKKKVSERFPSQPKLPSAETTNKLLSEDQSRIAMSVTEQTTARLDEKVGESR
jgi:zinc ribbon protein